MEVTNLKLGAYAPGVLASTQVTCMLPVKDMARSGTTASIAGADGAWRLLVQRCLE